MEVRDAIRESWTAEVEGAVALASGVNQGAQQGAQRAHGHHHRGCAVAPLELLEVVVEAG